MSSIAKGFGDMIASIVEIFKGIIGAIFSTIQSVFALIASVFTSFFDMFEGLVGFILGASEVQSASTCIPRIR